MQARVTLLKALADELESNPIRGMTGAIREVELGHDKVFLAQSYQYANITHLTEALKARAQETGLDADALVNKIFERAVAEGPESVRELHDLLHFSDSCLMTKPAVRPRLIDWMRASFFWDRFKKVSLEAH